MQHLPALPGVYVVEMLNDEPMSVNSDRPGIAERCIRVNRANCKYGQAKNLARRERSYVRTFGRHNFRFRFYAVTENYAAVEAELALRLSAYRVPGQTGRPNEWLQDITVEEVEAIARSVVFQRGAVAPHAAAQRNNSVPGQAPQVLQEPLGVSPSRLINAASYLASAGMSVSLLRELHHTPRHDETFASTLRYFSRKFDLRHKNQVYGARLIHVADRHRQDEGSFRTLVNEALARHPSA